MRSGAGVKTPLHCLAWRSRVEVVADIEMADRAARPCWTSLHEGGDELASRLSSADAVCNGPAPP